MAWEQIAGGGLLAAANIERYETYIAEGQRASLQLNLRASVPEWVATELQNKLDESGVTEAQVVTGSPVLRIYWRKGLPWLAVIAAAILGLIVLAILIIGWQLFKDIVKIVPAPIVAGGAIVVLVLLAMVLLTRRRGTQWV